MKVVKVLDSCQWFFTFYGEVNRKMWINFYSQLRSITKPSKIFIHIDSHGGYGSYGELIHNTILQYSQKHKFVAYAVNECSSAAADIFLVNTCSAEP